ncbi:MAG TPA: macro domain-containing protein [Paenibacillus sp.]
MAVKVVSGDFFQAKEDILGHQVNCQGVMGSGAAKGIRDKFPEAYTFYQNEYMNAVDKKSLLGRCQLVQCQNGTMIANLFGQFKYGKTSEQYTDYEALESALTQLKNKATESKLSVALPYNLGCGMANGDWNVVEKMIGDIFNDYEVTLYKLG